MDLTKTTLDFGNTDTIRLGSVVDKLMREPEASTSYLETAQHLQALLLTACASFLLFLDDCERYQTLTRSEPVLLDRIRKDRVLVSFLRDTVAQADLTTTQDTFSSIVVSQDLLTSVLLGTDALPLSSLSLALYLYYNRPSTNI